VDKQNLKYYSESEERLNVLTHGLGLILSVVALILLAFKAQNFEVSSHVISFVIFGVSMILLYAASTFYHASQKPERRLKLKIADHIAIYFLIAGTYTPFTLVTLEGDLGWTIFGVTWGVAFLGMIFKLFFTGKFSKISTLSYVVMGWMIVFIIGPLADALPTDGLYWLIGGGIFYTVGAILYSLPKLKYNHAIFHVFVLLGSFSHFMTVYFYV